MNSKVVALPASKEESLYLDLLLTAAEEHGAFAIVILGSVARAKRSGLWSDFDILSVDLSAPEEPPIVHLIEIKSHDLRKRALAGDDFAQWSLRFGRPIFGEERWHDASDEWLASAPWPDADVKIRQASKKLRLATDIFAVGDEVSAQREAVYAASHLARAKLFKRNVFPLSRPELPSQLDRAEDKPLAVVLRQLTTAILSPSDLQDCLRQLTRELKMARET